MSKWLSSLWLQSFFLPVHLSPGPVGQGGSPSNVLPFLLLKLAPGGLPFTTEIFQNTTTRCSNSNANQRLITNIITIQLLSFSPMHENNDTLLSNPRKKSSYAISTAFLCCNKLRHQIFFADSAMWRICAFQCESAY